MSLSLTFAQSFERALEYQQSGEWAAAEAILDRLLQEFPGQAHALYLLGLVRSGQRRLLEAAELIEQAIRANPDEALFLHHLQEVYRRLGRLDEALVAGRRAVAAFPQEAMLWANLAAIHRDRLELDEAVAPAQHALALQPDLAEAHLALAEIWLLAGDFERGWAEYEWRFGISGAGPLMAPTDQPAWQGQALSGRLLLIGDQGFGDVIQFSRYIPLAAARCGVVAVACAPEMQGLLQQIWPALAVFGRWEKGIACEAWAPLSSLPRLCGKMPAPRVYLRADATCVAKWAERLATALPGPGLRVGIVWAGSPEHQNDGKRSTQFTTFAALLSVPGLRLVSLQRGQAQLQLAGADVYDAGSALEDFTETMGLLGALDLLITVDTAVAHLAGAMGRPVWILLPYAPDWRWLLHRADTPWYPTARLFRQQTPGDWAHVVAEVVVALQDQLIA